jgi:hypothetical protein
MVQQFGGLDRLYVCSQLVDRLDTVVLLAA